MSAIKKLMTKSFLERAISGILLVIIALVTIILGKDVLFATITIISLIGLSEILKVFKVHNRLPGFAAYLVAIGYFALLRFEYQEYFMPLFIGYIIILMAIYVFTFPKFTSSEIIPCFFSLFYVAVMLSYVYQVRMMEDGLYTVWLIFICSWGCDTCAYLVGVMFGKHKMAPILSPKKSVEGGIGGVVGAALLGFVYALIFKGNIHEISNPMVTFPVICAVGGIISQVGDLCASGIKRNNDIKDYGKLIPGHGGVLDRFDSVIFTAPIIFYLITL